MARSLNVSLLAAALTEYYLKFQQGLHKEFEFGLLKGKHNLTERFTVIPGVPDRLVLGSVTAEDFIHQYAPSSPTSFNPKDDVIKVKPRTYISRDFEGDLLFLDKDIVRTWLMWQSGMENIEKMSEAEKMKRFVEYLFKDVLNAKAMRTLRKAVIRAIFDDSLPHAWNKILTGFEELVNIEVLAGNITLNVLPAIDENNVIQVVESVFDTVSEETQDADDLVIVLDTPTFRKFCRANRGVLGRQFDYNNATSVTVDGFPNAKIIKDPDATQFKIAVHRVSDFVLGVNFTDNLDSQWEFQRADRATKMMLNGKVGLEAQVINKDKPNVAVGA